MRNRGRGEIRRRPAVVVGFNEGKKLSVVQPAKVDITMMIDGDTRQAACLTECVSRVHPGTTLMPVHSHAGIEEIAYVLEGEGEVWAEGEVHRVRQGDSILWPPDCRHTVSNPGEDMLVLLCFFSSPRYRDPGYYITHEEIGL